MPAAGTVNSGEPPKPNPGDQRTHPEQLGWADSGPEWVADQPARGRASQEGRDAGRGTRTGPPGCRAD